MRTIAAETGPGRRSSFRQRKRFTLDHSLARSRMTSPNRRFMILLHRGSRILSHSVYRGCHSNNSKTHDHLVQSDLLNFTLILLNEGRNCTPMRYGYTGTTLYVSVKPTSNSITGENNNVAICARSRRAIIRFGTGCPQRSTGICKALPRIFYCSYKRI